MTLVEKRDFIVELVGGIQRDLIIDCARVPEDWNGLELREWIVDRFSDRALIGSMLKGQRLKAYQNAVLVENL